VGDLQTQQAGPDDEPLSAEQEETADGGPGDADGSADREVGPGFAKSTTAGGVAGAAMGGLVAGPPGMIVGAVTGAVRGALFQHVVEKVDESAAAKGREIADSLFGPPEDASEPA
jgi:hypothetical protein